MLVPSTVFATMLVVCGILTYYFAPMAMLYQNTRLFMLIMNSILVIMILWLALLAQILLPHVEKLTLFVMLHTCYYKARKMKILLNKNLRNHQSRNQRPLIFQNSARAL